MKSIESIEMIPTKNEGQRVAYLGVFPRQVTIYSNDDRSASAVHSVDSSTVSISVDTTDGSTATRSVPTLAEAEARLMRISLPTWDAYVAILAENGFVPATQRRAA